MTEFQEYIKQGEPKQKEKSYLWQTAIGLQAVDGLETSEYLRSTACRHIEGEISIAEVKDLLNAYYSARQVRKEKEHSRQEEADKVATRITELLSEDSFTLSPATYIAIHQHLFQGIYPYAGKLRDYNISKKEWVLDGDSVYYASATSLKETLAYDIEQEQKFTYRGLSIDEVIQHIVSFVANLWQIHPFGEGNTRTTAVFIIKYLRVLGFEIDNEMFSEHSCYFRNALVRANYNNLKKGVYTSNTYLEYFFRNLLLGEKNNLSTKALHINSNKDND